jgi:uncharacterized repeat protein (TIGR03803 family)
MFRFCKRVFNWKSGSFLPAAILTLGLGVQAAQAQTFKVIHYFSGLLDGGNSVGPLTEGPDHRLYGVSNLGGKYLFGNVFKIAKDGRDLTVVNSFEYWNGYEPSPWLIFGPAGTILGTTSQGGGDNDLGVFYELSAHHKETVLHQFPYGGTADGWAPGGPMATDGQGNIYAATGTGGTSDFGTIYKIDTSGNETILYNFLGQSDGSGPEGLVSGPGGYFYGTTACSDACYTGGSGHVFKVDSAGNLTILYTFSGGADGGDPNAYLLFDAKGNIFGTTGLGGNSGCPIGNFDYGCGVVFKLTPEGKESVIYAFPPAPSLGGANPSSGVIADGKGNLYGVTVDGGTDACGVAYKVSLKGEETVLHSFQAPDGCPPEGEMLLSGNTLYGVSRFGAGAGFGSLWTIDLK